MTRSELSASNTASPEATRAVRRAQLLHDLGHGPVRARRASGSSRTVRGARPQAWDDWGTVYEAFSAALAGPNSTPSATAA